MVGLGGHHVLTLARERIARLSSGPAASITDTLTHPTITNETSPHFAEASRRLPAVLNNDMAAVEAGDSSQPSAE